MAILRQLNFPSGRGLGLFLPPVHHFNGASHDDFPVWEGDANIVGLERVPKGQHDFPADVGQAILRVRNPEPGFEIERRVTKLGHPADGFLY